MHVAANRRQSQLGGVEYPERNILENSELVCFFDISPVEGDGGVMIYIL
jgi:hypothetical protein